MGRKHDKPRELGNLRKRAEAMLGDKASYAGDLSPEEAREALEELRTHQIELELQNEELRRTQADLVASRDRYSDFRDFSPVGYATINDKGIIVEANLPLATMLGLERRALIRMLFSALVVDEDQDTYYHHRRELLETRRQRTCELRLRKRGGSPFWAYVGGIAVDGPNDSGDQFRLAVIDITERKQAEEERECLEEQLLQAQKMEAIGLLAGGVAHDFRNQLTVIKGYGERLLRRSLVSEEGIRPVEEILKATERSAATAGQLLAFSRRELLHPKVVDLNVLVSDMAKTLPQMIGEDIRLSTAFCCTACRLNVDANQLQQAILNLVVNARHVMPAGGELAVETSRLEADESFCRRHTDTRPGPYVALSVSDTGCGMDAETLGKIFDPFFTTRRLGEGAGLGLSMVYGFVKQSGGAIEVESEPGKGSVFRLYFPRVETAAIPIGNTEVPEDIPRGDETILIVEDENIVRKMLAVNLRDFGYTVIEAGCAAEAMPLARDYAGQIDVLVTDFVMPGMNGAELARRIGQSRPETAVLYVTGYKSAELSQHGLDGVNPRRMLIKPFSPAELSRRIRETLDPATPPTEP